MKLHFLDEKYLHRLFGILLLGNLISYLRKHFFAITISRHVANIYWTRSEEAKGPTICGSFLSNEKLCF